MTSSSFAPSVALRASVNNFLVIWRLFRLRDDSLALLALTKADRNLHTTIGRIRSGHLQDNQPLLDLYVALDDFLTTWAIFGLLPNWRSFTPVLDPARVHLQEAFGLSVEPTQVVLSPPLDW